jgi:hypothetical protein
VGRSPSSAGVCMLHRHLGRPEVRATITRSLRTQQRAEADPSAPVPRSGRKRLYWMRGPEGLPTGQCSTLERPSPAGAGAWLWTTGSRADRQVLLRKEVIQPHLPVRLPCYDFVPIADPTFDSSLSCELGHWLRVLPTFVT